jgi:ABC-type dipeptide/oligopeptide/nickel transport system ATPase component
MEIRNLYDVMDPKYLKKAKNPNFALHHFNLPFRACVVAPSGSGKTNLVLNIIEAFSKDEGTFATIQIITRDKNEPLYNWLQEKAPSIQITEGLTTLKPLTNKNYDPDLQHLVVLDDLVLSKDLSAVEAFYIRGRKLGVSVIFISQSYFRIPKTIRGNCSYMILLKLSGQREVNLILSEFGLGVTKDQLLRLYQRATTEKFVPLIIDLEAQPEERFRRGLLEVLNPMVQ